MDQILRQIPLKLFMNLIPSKLSSFGIDLMTPCSLNEGMIQFYCNQFTKSCWHSNWGVLQKIPEMNDLFVCKQTSRFYSHDRSIFLFDQVTIKFDYISSQLRQKIEQLQLTLEPAIKVNLYRNKLNLASTQPNCFVGILSQTNEYGVTIFGIRPISKQNVSNR